METKLERISQLSVENRKMVFTSIGHLINKELLKECHKQMDGKKAAVIDGMTKDAYGENLDANLEELAGRLKRHAYKPQPARKVEIPKENGKTRPLSIYFCHKGTGDQQPAPAMRDPEGQPQAGRRGVR